MDISLGRQFGRNHGTQLFSWGQVSLIRARRGSAQNVVPRLETKKLPRSPLLSAHREGFTNRGSGRSRTDDGGLAIGTQLSETSDETHEGTAGRGARRGNSAAQASAATDVEIRPSSGTVPAMAAVGHRRETAFHPPLRRRQDGRNTGRRTRGTRGCPPAPNQGSQQESNPLTPRKRAFQERLSRGYACGECTGVPRIFRARR